VFQIRDENSPTLENYAVLSVLLHIKLRPFLIHPLKITSLYNLS